MAWSFRNRRGSHSGPRHAAPGSTGGVPPHGTLSPAEREADAAATDWQIILHLRTLFERDPRLIEALLEDLGSGGPPGLVATVLVAAREALVEQPDSADLHYFAARAALADDRRSEARALAARAVELEPGHTGALTLLATTGDKRHAPSGANTPAPGRPVRSEGIGGPAAGGSDRRGNELPA